MEKMKMKKVDQKGLMIKELIEGIEATKELRNQIIRGSNQASTDDQALINHSLIDKMLSTFDKTISLAKKMAFHQQPITTTSINDNNNNNSSNQFKSDSPRSLAISNPRSEDSHQNHHVSKKRKMMPRWTKTVQVCPGGKISGLEGPLNDGYSWRKYGQKDILRAKYPRGYYRCTHQPTQNCLAKKQVQQSDDDPSIYQIIYHGEHTCFQAAQTKPNPTQIKTELPPPPPPPSLPTTLPQQNHIALSPPPPPPPPPHDEIYLGLGPNGELKVEAEENIKEAQFFRSFSFTSAGLLESGPTDNYNLSCLPAFASPTTSESNHFSMSPYEPIASPGSGLNVQTSDSDLYEAISGPNSVANSPKFDDFEFPLDQLLDICELPEF